MKIEEKTGREVRMRSSQVAMDEVFWKFFDQYYVIINIKLKKRGHPRVSRGRLLGAITSNFLLAHFLHEQFDPDDEFSDPNNFLGLLDEQELKKLGLADHLGKRPQVPAPK